jgi:DNA-binding PadR family transcriptional regulator
MMTKRKIQNPLALAVLACLTEHPMHPYEIATTLRERAKDQSIKLNYGALYTVVEALKLHGLISARESEREGRRPERTVYRLTKAGRIELIDWLSELISRPVKEYTQFEAGLSLIPVLPPEDAVVLLEQRCKHLEMEIEQQRSFLHLVVQRGISRLNLIESEYLLALHEAELAWTRHFAEAIRSGRLPGLTEWVTFSRATASQEYEASQQKEEPNEEKS